MGLNKSPFSRASGVRVAGKNLCGRVFQPWTFFFIFCANFSEGCEVFLVLVLVLSLRM